MDDGCTAAAAAALTPICRTAIPLRLTDTTVANIHAAISAAIPRFLSHFGNHAISIATVNTHVPTLLAR